MMLELTTRFLPKILFIISMLFITSCSNLGYYAQSASGQLDVINRTKSIADILEQADTDPALKQRLELVLKIRNYASATLGLPDNDSYRSYADLERPYAIWNVFAAPPLSLESTRWCFPFAGCVSYKGYFDKKDADEFADELREQGQDVYVAGISAYSTLGWFDDPMLNTIIKRHEPELAGLIFHELAHQQLYVQDDTEFNESFAMTVELEGTKQWLDSVNKQNSEKQYQDFIARKKRRIQFVELVMETRKILGEIYASEKNNENKLLLKAETIKQTRIKYSQLRKQWQGYKGYDNWFNKEINNAKLGSIGTYHRFVPAFKILMAQNKNKHKNGEEIFTGFFQAVEKISKLDKNERHEALDSLVKNNILSSTSSLTSKF